MFLRSEKNLRNLPELLLNMPANKNALLRYKTIDKCLRNRARRWTLEDLVEACSDALYEYSGKDEYLSVRTIQLDIQRMRSDELGYNAPIVVLDRKYYTYEDPEYSISNVPLTDSDLGQMREAVAVLKQLSGFGGFSGVDDIVGRLEDCVNAVGVDVNTASPSLLQRVAGLNATTAKNVVAYREENGPFTSRKQILKVPKLGPKAFEQCAGFMRITGGKNPLDGTSVHPESYEAVEKLFLNLFHAF